MKLTRHIILAFACAGLESSTHAATAARGDPDLSFNPSLNKCISSLAVQADGKILIAGAFTEAGGMGRSGLARLHPDGTLDQGFNPNPNLGTSVSDVPVSSMAIQADGKILIGGFFTSVGEVARTNLARLNADGTLDLTFNPAVDHGSFPSAGGIVVQTNGNILIGGSFTVVNGVARNSLARLNVDGTLDMDFHPMFGTSSEQVSVFEMAMQPEGKILVTGRLLKIDGTYRNYLVRLNSDGTLDMDFAVDVAADVESMALQADGKILIGGDFSTVSGVRRLGLARLNTDGTLDLGFTPQQDYKLTDTIAVLPDGKILIGSDVLGGGLAQLNTNGALDPDFNPHVNGGVWYIAIQVDGKILITGSFTSVNGISRSYLARLLGQPANEVSICCVSVVDNLPGFDITSVSARAVVIEGSTNLVNWSAIQTIPVGNGPVRYSDPDGANFQRRFYRVSSQP